MPWSPPDSASSSDLLTSLASLNSFPLYELSKGFNTLKFSLLKKISQAYL